MTGQAKAVDVLLVEDDAGDVLITRDAFERHNSCNPLHVVSDGEEAIRFLRRSQPFTQAPRPALILLDLNLPTLSGLDVLAEIKGDEDLRTIPVVMLSTSRAEQDIYASYSLHANAYIAKPVDFDQFSVAMQQIDAFFLSLVERCN